MSKVATQTPALADDTRLEKIVDKLEDETIRRKLALLMRLADAEQATDRGGTFGHALEQLFWLGVDDLCREALREVEELHQLADTGIDFALLSNKQGGGR